MKKTLLFLIIALVSSNSYAKWPLGFFNSQADIYSQGNITGVIEDLNGNLIVYGNFGGNLTIRDSSISTSKGKLDLFIAKLNSSGQLIWVRTAGSTGNDLAKSVKFDNNGNIIVAGNYSGNLILDNLTQLSSSNDICILKISPQNELLSATSFGRANDYVSEIAIDNNNNIYVSGGFQTSTTIGSVSYSINSSGATNSFLFKINSNSNVAWVQRYGTDTVNSIAEVNGIIYSNGHLFLKGGFNSRTIQIQDTILKNINKSSSSFVMSMDTNGTLKNIISLTPDVENAGVSLQCIDFDKDGNIYLAGVYGFSNVQAGNINIGSFSLSGSVSTTSMFFTKLNQNLQPLWAKSKKSSVNSGGIGGIVLDVSDDKNIYLAGYYFGNLNMGCKVSNTPSINNSDAFYCKFDTDGNCIWQNSTTSTNVSYSNSPIDILHSNLNNKTYIVTYSQASAITYHDGNTVTNSTTSIFSSIDSFVDNNVVTELIDNKNSESEIIKIFPNPAQDVLNIGVSTSDMNHNIKILDNTGKIVYTSTITNTLQINTNAIGTKGLYLIQILDSQNNVQVVKKFVLE